jgi:hypothetical protein
VPIDSYEDVTGYGMDPEVERELIARQNECTFNWATKDGWPMGVIMSYLERDGHFWLTSSGQRKRIPAVRRDGRVSIVISSSGTDLRPGKAVTYKGRCTVHEDPETKAWFYPAMAHRLRARWGPESEAEFAMFLDSPRRVILEVAPVLRIGFDGDKMRDATIDARRAARPAD